MLKFIPNFFFLPILLELLIWQATPHSYTDWLCSGKEEFSRDKKSKYKHVWNEIYIGTWDEFKKNENDQHFRGIKIGYVSLHYSTRFYFTTTEWHFTAYYSRFVFSMKYSCVWIGNRVPLHSVLPNKIEAKKIRKFSNNGKLFVVPILINLSMIAEGMTYNFITSIEGEKA